MRREGERVAHEFDFTAQTSGGSRGFVGFGQTPTQKQRKFFEAILVGRGLNLVR